MQTMVGITPNVADPRGPLHNAWGDRLLWATVLAGTLLIGGRAVLGRCRRRARRACPPRPPTAPAPLDLAAMTLTPRDLPGAGFVLHNGFTATPPMRAGADAERTGTAVAAARAALNRLGWCGCYRSRLVRFAVEDGSIETSVASTIDAYRDAAGAAADLPAVLARDLGPTARAVDPVRPLGEEVGLRATTAAAADGGAPVHVLRLAFRWQRLIGTVEVAARGPEPPSVARAEALGRRLLARMQHGLAAPEPGLSTQILRVRGPAHQADFDAYTRRGGRSARHRCEADDEYARRVDASPRHP